MKYPFDFVVVLCLSLNILLSSSTFSTEHDPMPPRYNSKFKPSLPMIEELPESDIESDWDAIMPLLKQVNFGGNWEQIMIKEDEQLMRGRE